MADACIEAMNNRWFAKRQISAESWDGKTKFEIQESEAERNERLKKWEQFLEDEKERKTEGGGEPSTAEASGAAASACDIETSMASPSVCQSEKQTTQGAMDTTSGAQGDS